MDTHHHILRAVTAFTSQTTATAADSGVASAGMRSYGSSKLCVIVGLVCSELKGRVWPEVKAAEDLFFPIAALHALQRNRGPEPVVFSLASSSGNDTQPPSTVWRSCVHARLHACMHTCIHARVCMFESHHGWNCCYLSCAIGVRVETRTPMAQSPLCSDLAGRVCLVV